MRILSFEVEKLFGYYNYHIQFKQDVTIIHGPNGCGKTTLIKLIDWIFNNKIYELKAVKFEKISILLSDNTLINVEQEKLSVELENHKITQIIFNVFVPNEDVKTYKFPDISDMNPIVQVLNGKRRIAPFIEKISDDLWFDRRSGENLTLEQMINKYGDMIGRHYIENFEPGDVPEELATILRQIKVKFITADRLKVQTSETRYGNSSVKVEMRVDIIAREIAEKIKTAINEYAQLSQAKDRSFPVRAIKNRKALTIEQIKEKMIELENKRKELVANGFLEETENITIQELIESITDESKKILTVYVADTEEKLNTFSKISALINMFKDLLSSNFALKEIVFDQNQGFYFSPMYSSETKIVPTNLSSGEQQEIVMFYDLIFNTSADTLVLVDEPELSLHIKWQLEYVDEMLKIINENDFYTLIATHSPQIINDKWDYTISLGEQG